LSARIGGFAKAIAHGRGLQEVIAAMARFGERIP